MNGRNMKTVRQDPQHRENFPPVGLSAMGGKEVELPAMTSIPPFIFSFGAPSFLIVEFAYYLSSRSLIFCTLAAILVLRSEAPLPAHVDQRQGWSPAVLLNPYPSSWQQHNRSSTPLDQETIAHTSISEQVVHGSQTSVNPPVSTTGEFLAFSYTCPLSLSLPRSLSLPHIKDTLQPPHWLPSSPTSLPSSSIHPLLRSSHPRVVSRSRGDSQIPFNSLLRSSSLPWSSWSSSSYRSSLPFLRARIIYLKKARALRKNKYRHSVPTHRCYWKSYQSQDPTR